MRFVTVRDLRGRPAEVWKELGKSHEMVLTSNGRPIAILSAVSEDTLEESLSAIRRARAVVAVNELQRKSVRAGTHKLGLKEINAEIATARKAHVR